MAGKNSGVAIDLHLGDRETSYDAHKDTQRRIDELQQKMAEENYSIGGNVSGEIYNKTVNIVFGSIDRFQVIINNMQGSEAVKQEYLQKISTQMEDLAEREIGDEFVAEVKHIDQIINVFLLKVQFEESAYDLFHGKNLKQKSRKDYAKDFKGSETKYAKGKYISFSDKYKKANGIISKTSVLGIDMLTDLFGDELSGLEEVANQIQSFKSSDEYGQNITGIIAHLENLLSSIGKKDFYGVKDISELKRGEIVNYESGVEYLLFKKMIESKLGYNIALIQVEAAKRVIKNTLIAYGNGDKEKFQKGLSASVAYLKKAKQKLKKNTNELGDLAATDQFSELSVLIQNLNKDIDNLRKTFRNLEEKTGELNRQEVLGGSLEILEKLLALKVGANLSENDKKLLAKVLGDDFLQSISETNGSAESVADRMKELEKQLKKIASKIEEKQLAIEDLESQITNNEEENKKIIEKQKKLRESIALSMADIVEAVKQKINDIGYNGSLDEALGVDEQKMSLDGLGDLEQSNIESYSDDISFGFDDKIKAHTNDNFQIYPAVGEVYFPSEVISDFDLDTSRGKIFQKRDKKIYENTDIETTSTYVGKTNKEITKLSLPHNFTVNTGSLKLSEDIYYNILKDDYGFVYLVLDNPSEREIEFTIKIGFDDTHDDFPVSEEISSQLTEKLFSGAYSKNTQDNLFSVVRSNPEDYKTGESVAQKVQSFIQANYIYALDSSLNERIGKYGNQVEAIENMTVDHNGEKLHPAICNISARMAVAYLRELGVPSVVVTGDMKMSGNEYGKHAWIRYFDKSDNKWRDLDPTPTRQWKEVKYEFTDPRSQQLYESQTLERENDIKKGELEAKKRQENREAVSLIVIQEKIKNEQSIYQNDQFLGLMLKGNLQGSFDAWKNEFDLLIKEYQKIPSKDLRDEFYSKKIKAFISKTFSNINELISKSALESKNKDLYRIAYEHNLAIIEQILKVFPKISVEDYFLQYEDQYGKEKIENLSRVIGSFDDGRDLVVLNDKLYMRNRDESFALKPVMDLSEYKKYYGFQTSPSGRDWAFIAEDNDGKLLTVKNGVEQVGRYEKIIGNLQFSVAGDLFLHSSINNGVSKAYKNGVLIGGELGSVYMSDFKINEKGTIVVTDVSMQDSFATYFINENPILDDSGNYVKFSDPIINFFGDNVIIQDDSNGFYLNGERILSYVSISDMASSNMKKINIGILLMIPDTDGSNKIILIKNDGSFNTYPGVNSFDDLYLNGDGSNNAFIENREGPGFAALVIDGVDVIENKGYSEIDGFKISDDLSEYSFYAKRLEGGVQKSIVIANGKEVFETEGVVYNMSSSGDFSHVRVGYRIEDENGNEIRQIAVVNNGQKKVYEDVRYFKADEFDKSNPEKFVLAKKHQDGVSYVIDGKPVLNGYGELFTLPSPFEIRGEGPVKVATFNETLWEADSYVIPENDNSNNSNFLRQSFETKAYLFHRDAEFDINRVHEIESDYIAQSDNKNHIIYVYDHEIPSLDTIDDIPFLHLVPNGGGNIEYLKISNDGENYGYLHTFGNTISVIRNGEVIWSSENNPLSNFRIYSLGFSDDFQHFILGKTMDDIEENISFSYVDGAYLNDSVIRERESRMGTWIYNQADRIVKNGKIKIPDNTTVIRGPKGTLNFETRNQKTFEKTFESIELMRGSVKDSEFAMRTFDIGSRFKQGKKVEDSEHIFVLQNYCNIGDTGVLGYDKDQFKNLLIRDRTKFEKRLVLLESKKSLSKDEILEKRKIGSFLRKAENFLSSFDDLEFEGDLRSICDNIVQTQYALFFDNSIKNIKAKIDGSFSALKLAIETGDQEMINEIVGKLKNESWKIDVIDRIRPQVFLPNRFVISSSYDGKNDKIISDVRNNKLRDIYFELGGERENGEGY